ncbi:translation initiation factor IF-2-like [Cervus elaphus]|uniref:translation initiation factor IF-2-like n=1 Tax=Cervus elaphus TaxID=9860 RepID=UPI001CC2C892|nr:translation initiation factor IF-2-like [Cervus elaphus]
MVITTVYKLIRSLAGRGAGNERLGVISADLSAGRRGAADDPQRPAFPATPQQPGEGALAPARPGQSPKYCLETSGGGGCGSVGRAQPGGGPTVCPGPPSPLPAAGSRAPGVRRWRSRPRSPAPTPRAAGGRQRGAEVGARKVTAVAFLSARCLRDLMYFVRRGLLSRPPNDRRKIFSLAASPQAALNQINLAIKGQDV